jgi:hypothetical protein
MIWGCGDAWNLTEVLKIYFLALQEQYPEFNLSTAKKKKKCVCIYLSIYTVEIALSCLLSHIRLSDTVKGLQ